MKQRYDFRKALEARSASVSTLVGPRRERYNANIFPGSVGLDLLQKGSDGEDYIVSYKVVKLRDNKRAWEFVGAEKR